MNHQLPVIILFKTSLISTAIMPHVDITITSLNKEEMHNFC